MIFTYCSHYMKKVFIVTAWSYSDHTILWAFETEEDAKAFTLLFSDPDNCYIEEYEIWKMSKGVKLYRVEVKLDYTIWHWRNESAEMYSWVSDRFMEWWSLWVWLLARNEEEARKMAIDDARVYIPKFQKEAMEKEEKEKYVSEDFKKEIWRDWPLKYKSA